MFKTENALEKQKIVEVKSEVMEKAVEIAETIKDNEVVSKVQRIADNAENKTHEVSNSTSSSKGSEHYSLKNSSEESNVYKSENLEVFSENKQNTVKITAATNRAENIIVDETSFQHKPGSTNGTEQLVNISKKFFQQLLNYLK